MWDVLADLGGWSHWWPAAQSSVLIAAGDEAGLGRSSRLRIASPLGYSFDVELRAVRIEPGCGAVLAASGDLTGSADVRMRAVGPVTIADILWDVTSNRRSLRLLTPLARWAHARVMDAAEAGLRSHLARS